MLTTARFVDLNRTRIASKEVSDGRDGRVQTDHSIRDHVYFKDLAHHLIRHIRDADLIVGCVAWLTHGAILDALATRRTMLVVQKEDFLRPDLLAYGDWRTHLRARYDALTPGPWKFAYDNLAGTLSFCGATEYEPVRCCGMRGKGRDSAPKMHHKFVVFCHIDENIFTQSQGDGYPTLTVDATTVRPYAVWTGSFNFTVNATASFENAVYLTAPDIVNAYYNEWAQIVALSEPLDWWHEYIAPDLHIGS